LASELAKDGGNAQVAKRSEENTFGIEMGKDRGFADAHEN
jgi:hypothetical protein